MEKRFHYVDGGESEERDAGDLEISFHLGSSYYHGC